MPMAPTRFIQRGPDIPLLTPAPGFALGLAVVEQGGPVLVLRVAGDIDLATAEQLQAQLHLLVDAGYRQLVVDLSVVGFSDAAGVAAFEAARQRADAHGGCVRLVAPQQIVAKVLRITADTHELTTHATVAQAAAAPSPADRTDPRLCAAVWAGEGSVRRASFR